MTPRENRMAGFELARWVKRVNAREEPKEPWNPCKHPYDMKLETISNQWYYAGSGRMIWFPIDTTGYSPSSSDSKIVRGLLK